MAHRWPWIIVIAFCSLLTQITYVSAECAWVLWSESTEWGQRGKREPPSPENSYKTIEDRIRKIDDTWKTATDPVTTQYHRDAPTSATIKMKIGQRIGLITYTCLPDTIDPRGPKGK